MVSILMERLRSEILALPEEERAELAHEILKSLNGPLNRKSAARKQLDQLAATVRIRDVTTPLDSDWDTAP